MSPVLAGAIFFIIWWSVLFAVLPLGVTSQYEAGEVVPGSEGAAPHRPMLLRKLAITTAVAAVVFALVYGVIAYRLIPLDAIPIGPTFKD